MNVVLYFGISHNPPNDKLFIIKTLIDKLAKNHNLYVCDIGGSLIDSTGKYIDKDTFVYMANNAVFDEIIHVNNIDLHLLKNEIKSINCKQSYIPFYDVITTNIGNGITMIINNTFFMKGIDRIIFMSNSQREIFLNKYDMLDNYYLNNVDDIDNFGTFVSKEKNDYGINNNKEDIKFIYPFNITCDDKYVKMATNNLFKKISEVILDKYEIYLLYEMEKHYNHMGDTDMLFYITNKITLIDPTQSKETSHSLPPVDQIYNVNNMPETSNSMHSDKMFPNVLISPVDQVLDINQKINETYTEISIVDGVDSIDNIKNDDINDDLPVHQMEKHKINSVPVSISDDDSLIYPVDKIRRIMNRINDNNMQILFSITSCKRFDLFEKTINSFINCCDDVELIDRWLCLDDNSSYADRFKMQTLYPFFDFVWKVPSQKGHHISMNIILDNTVYYKYLVHLEDDFHFIKKMDYISYAINVLENDEQLGQVLFNKNYAEIELNELDIRGGLEKYTKDNLKYIEHEYIPDKIVDYCNVYFWPHFSFRPSVHRCSALLDIGLFYETDHFEMAFAYEYVEKYKSAFFDFVTSIHIGKKTWEKTANSYNMNNVKQFGSDINFMVFVIKTNTNNWKQFKEKSRYVLKWYRKFDNIDDCMFAIRELDASKRCMVMYDDCDFNHNLLDIANEIVEQTSEMNNFMLIIGNLDVELDCLHKPEIQESHNYNNLKYGFICDNYNNGQIYSLDKGIISHKQPEYKFIKNCDSHDNDIMYQDITDKNNDEVNKIANLMQQCVGYNSFGYFKYVIKPKNEFTELNGDHGLYIRLDRWIYDDVKQQIIDEKKNKIMNKNQNDVINNISFTITTCKRWNYFREVMDNFIYKCDDIEIFDRWICIDDNSSEEDRKKMQERYPFFNFVWKTIDDKGHAKSMNMLWDIIETDYVFHFEDDWLIYNKFRMGNFFGYMKDKCDQLIFVKQYHEHLPIICRIDGYNIYQKMYNTNHRVKPYVNKMYDESVNFDGEQNTTILVDQYWWWPGFSLNPSIMNFKRIKQIGKFNETDDTMFEYDYALKCYNDSIDIKFVDFCVAHIGYTSSYNL